MCNRKQRNATVNDGTTDKEAVSFRHVNFSTCFIKTYYVCSNLHNPLVLSDQTHDKVQTVMFFMFVNTIKIKAIARALHFL